MSTRVKLANLSKIKWPSRSVANSHVRKELVISPSLVSPQKHPWDQLCSLWVDSHQPLVICQKMEMSKDQSEGNVGLSQTSWILSTLQLLPSSRGNWKRGECRNIFEGIQILSYPVGMVQRMILWLYSWWKIVYILANLWEVLFKYCFTSYMHL